MLALGSVSNKLRKHGNPERARRNVDKVHELLGYHGEKLAHKLWFVMKVIKKNWKGNENVMLAL